MKTDKKQGVLFAFDDSSDRSFEYKRAVKAQKREDRIGKIELKIILPHRFTTGEEVVCRFTSGLWSCSCRASMRQGVMSAKQRPCIHIEKIKSLLRLRKEAGWTGISEKKFLKDVLPAGEVK